MLIALFADIHANRPAFAACRARARELEAEHIVLLGDYVGYGADPEWTVQTVMEMVSDGAEAVIGNHDCAIGDPRERLNVEAQVVIEWSRGELGTAERDFLRNLPLTLRRDDRLYVHADASDPPDWKYVTDSTMAARSILATEARLTFCGHTHRPALYTMSTTKRMTEFTPVTDTAIQLLPGRRWLAVLGSVGQPRDGNPAASFALLDTDRHELTYCRVPYNIEESASRIRSKGLPHWLADRLFVGR